MNFTIVFMCAQSAQYLLRKDLQNIHARIQMQNHSNQW